VAIGDFVYQAQAPGGVINQIIVSEPIRPLPRPVDVRPRVRGHQIERSGILDEVTESVDRVPIQIVADDGWGKTSVVSQLAHHRGIEQYRDGIAVISGWGLPVEDLEQAIFDVFYQSTLPDTVHKVTPGQLRTSLGDVQAAILVDDLDIPRQHVDRLIDACGHSVFVSTASSQTMWSDGLVVSLEGLEDSDALSLFEHRLGRAIDPGNLEAVTAFLAQVRGFPMAIVAAASAARRGADLMGILPRLVNASDPLGAIQGEIATTFTLAETRLLSALAAVSGNPLPAEAVGRAAGVDSAGDLLEGLKRDGIVEAASPRYRLPRTSATVADLPIDGPATARGLAQWCNAETDASLISGAAPAIVSAIGSAVQAGDYEAAIALGRSADGAISLSGRWGIWGQVLDATRGAAVAATDSFAESWSLHQLGTMALAEQRHDEALSMLTEAANIRSQIGDRAGLEVTEHNLSLLSPPPAAVPPQHPTSAPSSSSGIPWWAWTMIVVGLLAVAGIIGYAVASQDPDVTVVTTVAAVNGELVPTTDVIEIFDVPAGASVSGEVELVNAGQGPVDIEDVSVDGHGSITAATGCDSLEPGESCLVTVTFSPPDPGEFRAMLIVEHSGANPNVEVLVSGTAIDPPEAFVSVDPVNLDFGVVLLREDGSRPVTITNAGNVEVDLANVRIDSDLFVLDNAEGEVEECETLVPDASCSINVRFIAKEPGVFEGTLFIDHSGDNPSFEIRLTGIVPEPPNLTIEIVDFGTTEGTFEIDFATFVASFWIVPVTVEITNSGQVAVVDNFAFRFEVLNTSDDVVPWLPTASPANPSGETMVDTPIGPGEMVRVNATIGLNTRASPPGTTELIRAEVDSCLEEGSPVIPPCRIVESNEDDNISDEFNVQVLFEGDG
jgi:hypothetical protein